MNKILLLLGLFITFMSTIEAQQLTHELGEIIVQVDMDRNMHSLIKTLKKSNSRYGGITYSQICKAPLNLWLIKSDPNNTNENLLLDEIIYSKDVVLAQKNHLTSYRNTIPNDPEFVNQWQYINIGTNTYEQNGTPGVDMDIDEAWDVTTGGMTANGVEIVACIIDDGIYENHEDFVDRLWVNTAEIPDNNIDDDNNGYIDDYRGWVIKKNNDHISQIYDMDNNTHGTPVAGIIGAHGNNDIGVSGINWDIKLMIVKGHGSEALALAAYAYPYQFRKLYNDTNGEEGAFVVVTNASWGTNNGQPEDAPIWCEFYNKLGEIGILNCGATANSNANIDEVGDLPTACSSDFLISVTNVNDKDQKVPNAGYGKKTIDLGAFGQNAWTSEINNNYGSFGGTSGATPQVAGTVALLYSIPCMKFAELSQTKPALAARFIKHVILSGVQPNASLLGKTVSGGRLNIKNSMDLAMDLCNEFTYPIDGTFDNGDELTWSNPPNAIQTNLRYRKKETTDWVTKTNVSSPYLLLNLELCSEYEVQLQSIYSGNITSEYSFSYATQTKGCCLSPSNLSYETLITPEGATVYELSWSSYEEAQEYTLEYKNANEENWLVLTTDNTSLRLDGLIDCNSYQVRIKSDCPLRSSNYSDTLNISSDCGSCTNLSYCDFGPNPDQTPDNDQEWIQRVKLHTLDNITSAENNSYGNYLGYNIPSLSLNESYELLLQPGYKESIYNEKFVVWIDYDQNQVFNDSEIVFDNDKMATKVEISTMITIPEDAKSGITRMRVAMRFNNPPHECGGFDYGEIEDYCIEITTPNTATELESVPDFIIAPNPFNTFIEVSVLGTSSRSITLTLRDINGKLVSETTRSNLSSDTNKIRFENLSELSNGIYFLSYILNGKTETKKLIKI